MVDVKWTESVHTLCREWIFNVELRSCQISLVDMLLHYFCTFFLGYNVTVMHRVIQLFV